MWVYRRWDNSYDFNQYDYNFIDYVYNNIRKDSRVIFIIRHAERWLDCSKEWWINKSWINQSKLLWKRLVWWMFKDTNSDFYWSTWYKRTQETSFYVWYGRWYSPFYNDRKIFENNWLEYDKIIHPIDVVDPYYLMYDTEFEQLNEKSVYMVNELCKLTEWHLFNFITSHDHLLIPLITWITNWSITFTREKWINYLAWVSVIINDVTKEWEVYPIRTFMKKSMVLFD